MRFLTPKLREVDNKSTKKILVKEKSAQEAAQVCVHYYFLTFHLDRHRANKKPTAAAVGKDD